MRNDNDLKHKNIIYPLQRLNTLRRLSSAKCSCNFCQRNALDLIRKITNSLRLPTCAGISKIHKQSSDGVASLIGTHVLNSSELHAVNRTFQAEHCVAAWWLLLYHLITKSTRTTFYPCPGQATSASRWWLGRCWLSYPRLHNKSEDKVQVPLTYLRCIQQRSPSPLLHVTSLDELSPHGNRQTWWRAPRNVFPNCRLCGIPATVPNCLFQLMDWLAAVALPASTRAFRPNTVHILTLLISTVWLAYSQIVLKNATSLNEYSFNNSMLKPSTVQGGWFLKRLQPS